jgi:hypothetical protein
MFFEFFVGIIGSIALTQLGIWQVIINSVDKLNEVQVGRWPVFPYAGRPSYRKVISNELHMFLQCQK